MESEEWSDLTSCEESSPASVYTERHHRELIERTPVAAGRGPFLEIGCGGGAFASLFSREYPSCRIVGYDVNPTLVERATQRGLPSSRVAFVVKQVDEEVSSFLRRLFRTEDGIRAAYLPFSASLIPDVELYKLLVTARGLLEVGGGVGLSQIFAEPPLPRVSGPHVIESAPSPFDSYLQGERVRVKVNCLVEERRTRTIESDIYRSSRSLRSLFSWAGFTRVEIAVKENVLYVVGIKCP